MDFPSWGQAFLLENLSWLHLRLVVELLYCIFWLLKVWQLLS